MSAANGVSAWKGVRPAKSVRTWALVAALMVLSTTTLWAQDSLRFGPFGTVHVYRPAAEPSSVVLFLSGDGGWNLGVVDMARSLANLDALVVGIDLPHYLARVSAESGECLDPPVDLEALGQYVQKRLGSESFQHPVLVGYSSGATLTYTTLVQAPPGTFAGGISLGFCPDQVLARPLCRSNGLEWHMEAGKHNDYVFGPVPAMPSPWVVLQGTIDQVCSVSGVESFVRQVKGAEVVTLPRVGHGFSVQRNWMPQFRGAFARLKETAAPPEEKSEAWSGGLPLTVLPAADHPGGPLAVMVTGDGGWAGLDRAVGKALADAGVAVVGLSSIKYFWHARTPEQAADDLDRILRHYAAAWNRDGYVLIGYSFGADVLPFMVNRLPPDTRAGVRLVALLSPSRSADFEIHIESFLDRTSRAARPTGPEWQKMTGLEVLCMYGTEETHSPCANAAPPQWTAVPLPGGHHFDGRYRSIAERILAALRPPTG